MFQKVCSLPLLLKSQVSIRSKKKKRSVNKPSDRAEVTQKGGCSAEVTRRGADKKASREPRAKQNRKPVAHPPGQQAAPRKESESRRSAISRTAPPTLKEGASTRDTKREDPKKEDAKESKDISKEQKDHSTRRRPAGSQNDKPLTAGQKQAMVSFLRETLSRGLHPFLADYKSQLKVCSGRGRNSFRVGSAPT